MPTHRVKEKLQSGNFIVHGDQWPIFLYKDCRYDPGNPWNGLLRNKLLIAVSNRLEVSAFPDAETDIQTYFYITEFCGPAP